MKPIEQPAAYRVFQMKREISIENDTEHIFAEHFTNLLAIVFDVDTWSWCSAVSAAAASAAWHEVQYLKNAFILIFIRDCN